MIINVMSLVIPYCQMQRFFKGLLHFCRSFCLFELEYFCFLDYLFKQVETQVFRIRRWFMG